MSMSTNSSDSISFDPIATRYDETRNYPPEVSMLIARELLRLSGAPAGGELLEIGIGTGRIALPLLAIGAHLTGVDISQRMVERLQAKYVELRAAEPAHNWGRLRVEMADITALPFTDASFDAAVAVHVLHLIPPWRRALDEVWRVLKPGGALLLGQDVRPGDDWQIRTQDHWREILRGLGVEPERVGARSYDAILDELRERGLFVEEQTIATWQSERTPREMLRYITAREWSLTWAVPDAPFDESARRLTAWMEQQFGGAMDTPLATSTSFKVARTVK